MGSSAGTEYAKSPVGMKERWKMTRPPRAEPAQAFDGQLHLQEVSATSSLRKESDLHALPTVCPEAITDVFSHTRDKPAGDGANREAFQQFLTAPLVFTGGKANREEARVLPSSISLGATTQ